MNTYFHPMLTEEVNLPFYVKCVGGLKNQGPISRLEGFPDYQWIHCTKGKGKLFIDGKEFNITPNTGMLIPAFMPHQYYAIKEPWETHFVAFAGYGVQGLLDTLDLKGFGVFLFDDIRFLDGLVTDIFIAAKSGTISSGYKSSAALYRLLVEIKNSIRENSNTMENIRFKRIQKVISYIESNYSKDISIEDMSEVIDISPQYLCRLFNQTLNLRPFAYLTKFRIQKAKEMLIDNKALTIGEICKSVGYNDQSYFSSIFKKNEGMTPVEYRNMYEI